MTSASRIARRLARELGRQVVDGFICHESITLDRVVEVVERSHLSLDNPGFCLSCGADAYGVEPDATRYTCEACEAPSVYGAEEVLLWLAGF